MAVASYEAIIDGIAAILRSVDGIGKIAEIDDLIGPTWTTLPKTHSAYWEIAFASEDQQGKSGAGRQLIERPVFTLNGLMPIHRETKSTRVWLSLVKRVCEALRHSPTLESVVDGCDLPRITRQDDQARAAVESVGEFACHHVTIELTVRQFQADPDSVGG